MSMTQKKSPGRPPKEDTVPFAIRLSRPAREALLKAAEVDERPAAQIAQRVIVAWLKRRGFLEQ
jgi:hypothetical protein